MKRLFIITLFLLPFFLKAQSGCSDPAASNYYCNTSEGQTGCVFLGNFNSDGSPIFELPFGFIDDGSGVIPSAFKLFLGHGFCLYSGFPLQNKVDGIQGVLRQFSNFHVIAQEVRDILCGFLQTGDGFLVERMFFKEFEAGQPNGLLYAVSRLDHFVELFLRLFFYGFYGEITKIEEILVGVNASICINFVVFERGQNRIQVFVFRAQEHPVGNHPAIIRIV